MDRLDQLSQKLLAQLEERQTSLGSECLSPAQLEAYTTGTLTAEEKKQVDAHLDSCLSCLNVFVEFRDLLSGVENPSPLAPNLETRLRSVITSSNPQKAYTPFLKQIWRTIRNFFEWEVSVGWSFGGALAGALLAIVVINLTPPGDEPKIARIPSTRDFGKTPTLMQPAIAPMGPINLLAGRPPQTGDTPHKLEIAMGGQKLSEGELARKTGELFREEAAELARKARERRWMRSVTGKVIEIETTTQEGVLFYTFAILSTDGKVFRFFDHGSPNFRENDSVEVRGLVREETPYFKFAGRALKITKSPLP